MICFLFLHFFYFCFLNRDIGYHLHTDWCFRSSGVLHLRNFVLGTKSGDSLDPGALWSQTSNSLKGYNIGFQVKAGLFLMAKYEHIEEEINAIKATQVIMLLNKILYGFGCMVSD